MFPECLNRVLEKRTEFLTTQLLPMSEGNEPIAYLLLSGCVVLCNRNGATAYVFWPGDLVVAPSEIPGSTLKLKAVAESVCISGPRTRLLEECARQLELTQWIWDQQSRREVELYRRLEVLTTETVERRVLLTVADLADRSQAASPGHPMPLAQNEIAELAGATRETTSTLLNRMRRRGMVVLGRRRIEVATPDVLRALRALPEEVEPPLLSQPEIPPFGQLP
jgi:CRP-like cAMP-binding protein